MAKRIYMAGAGGMLGDGFYKKLHEKYEIKSTDIKLTSPWVSYLDFRELDSYLKDVAAFRPDYLFHLGAHTDLEYCEKNEEDAYKTNVSSVENACIIANKLEIPLLYIGTAGIFDGKKDVYDDWDIPNPLGVYGRTKCIGENIVRDSVRRHLICRAGWMMGGGPNKDKKFIQKLVKQIKDGCKELHIVNDKCGTPTYTHDFALNVELLVKEELWGTYNMVCGGITSRIEVARELIEILGLTESVKLVEVSSDYFRKEYFAARPLSERLINKKLNLRGLNVMRDWRIALQDYVHEEYKTIL